MKILFLDIETQPDLVWTWGVYEQNAIAVKEHWQLLSFSAEWLESGKKMTKGLPDYKGYKPGGDDFYLVNAIWNLLDEADIVVAHNGVDFDIKSLNARFIAHGLTPPSPFKVVDTKRQVKSVARFSSNKLDWLCKQLEIGQKVEHDGWSLWLGCMAGDKKCWKRMKDYNRHDVVLLKKLYKLISPWIKQPNANMWQMGDEIICVNPACKSTNLIRKGKIRNKTRMYQQWRCKDCGKWCASVHSEGKKATVA